MFISLVGNEVGLVLGWRGELWVGDLGEPETPSSKTLVLTVSTLRVGNYLFFLVIPLIGH